MAGINQIIFVWLLTSLIGHNYHSGAGPGSLGVNNLEGNQILGVGRQAGDDVSEIHKHQLSDTFSEILRYIVFKCFYYIVNGFK